MNAGQKQRTIVGLEPRGSARLMVRWSDDATVELDLSPLLQRRGFAPLSDPDLFNQARVGEWGHSVEWPGGVEIGADQLWLETLSATGHEDTRAFLEWRLRHGLSLTRSAQALGLSRRMVAYYSSGEKKVPRPILLACRGWEADARLSPAAGGFRVRRR